MRWDETIIVCLLPLQVLPEVSSPGPSGNFPCPPPNVFCSARSGWVWPGPVGGRVGRMFRSPSGTAGLKLPPTGGLSSGPPPPPSYAQIIVSLDELVPAASLSLAASPSDVSLRTAFLRRDAVLEEKLRADLLQPEVLGFKGKNGFNILKENFEQSFIFREEKLLLGTVNKSVSRI